MKGVSVLGAEENISDGRETEEATEGWRKFHDEDLHNFYFSHNIVSMINSRRMRRRGHVARMREMRNAYTIYT
jgi:hypothetical protein